jgi:ABC-2 type transport system permease protein
MRNEAALGPMLTTVSQPIMLLSGVLLPLTLAPLWLRRVADGNPFYWATNGMRSLFQGNSGASSVWLSLVIVVGLAVLTLTWSVRLFARSVQ